MEKVLKRILNIANYWYEKTSRQGYQYAQNKLNKLKRGFSESLLLFIMFNKTWVLIYSAVMTIFAWVKISDMVMEGTHYL
ncbi:hypothetical protein RhiirA5_430351 [Rhizophagus irregularis]|uniref:Uncharacterized protein n=1 Tax=Rhizophagus irregularis TaxID=588596 RepID=A0A2N0NWW4_9GLOM|nr:hypothetical protein RhiirA5_430351 [Rhizophagus irregularis]